MSYRKTKSKDEEIPEIVKRIKKLRALNNESQGELAGAISTTNATIQNIEQCKSSPTLDTAIRIAEHYNVSLDYICGLDEDMTVPQDVLNTLCQFVKISTHEMSLELPHKIPVISINKALFDYLNVLDKAEQLKRDGVPDEVISAYVEKTTGEAVESIRCETTPSFVEYALLSQRDITSEEAMALLEKTYRESRG